MSEAMVQVRNVSKVYERGKQKVPVLQGLTLDIPQGDFVALMGPSGSGKTTLLNLIGGLDQPTSGEILVGGSRIDKLSAGQLAKWRAGNVGFVFQFYNLMPVLTAEGNVELPLLLTKLRQGAAAQERRRRARRGRPGRSRQAQAARALRRPGAARGDRARDRVRPAHCWSATSPPATSTARPPTRSCACCRRSTSEHGKTIVMVTHDPKAAEYAKRILHLEKGQLLEQVTAVA